MLPVNGFSCTEILNFDFYPKSTKVIFSIFLQVLCFVEFVMMTYYAFVDGLNFDLIGSLLHYFIAVFTMAYMLYYARKWKNFMKVWNKHEEIFLFSPYSNRALTKSFVRKVRIVGFFIIGYTISKFFIL